MHRDPFVHDACLDDTSCLGLFVLSEGSVVWCGWSNLNKQQVVHD